jgi:hypothetical protein
VKSSLTLKKLSTGERLRLRRSNQHGTPFAP